MKTISIQQKYKEQAKMLVALEMEVKDLRAKAEAWDKGVERMAVYNGKGDFMWTDNYLEKPQKADLPVGCHYRKVRVCEVAAAGEKPALATK